MRRLSSHLFPDRGDFKVFLAIMAACICGLLGVTWWAGIFLPGILLTLLSWSHWHDLAAKAAKVDEGRRERGALERRLGVSSGFQHFVRAHLLLMVLTLKFSQDWLFAAAAYGFGMAARWAWGV